MNEPHDSEEYFERAQSSLVASKASSILDGLLTEGEAHRTAMRDEADTLAKRALDLTLNSGDARAAKQKSDDLVFEVQRFDLLMEHLRKRASELKTIEADAAAKKEYAAAKAERDELVVVLRERWPTLAGEMIDILRKIEASDRRLDAVNRGQKADTWLPGAEEIARGARPGWKANPGVSGPPPFTSEGGVRIPDFSADYQRPSGVAYDPRAEARRYT